MILVSGCTNIQSEIDPFVEIYKDAAKITLAKSTSSAVPKKYDFSAHDMSLPDFAVWLSDHSGYGIIYSDALDNKTITAEIKRASVHEIISVVVRRLGCKVFLDGNTFYLGELSKDDRGFLVKKICNYSPESVSQIMSAFNSDQGKTVYVGDLLLVSDTISSLAKIDQVLAAINSHKSEVWILQYYLILAKSGSDLSAGGRVTTSGELSYSLSSDGGSDAAVSDLGQNINLVLTGQSSDVQVIAAPLFMLQPSHVATWSDSTTVPIPMKTVSDNGTVTTTGVDYRDVGLILKVQLTESSQGAFLDTELEDSTIVGYIDYYPQIQKSQYTTKSQIVSGQIYLLGELRKTSKSRSITDLLTFGVKNDYTNIQIYVRGYRIDLASPYNADFEISERLSK